MRCDPIDLLAELLELSQELQADILQQLNYYRASAYKAEAAGLIENKVDQLQFIVGLYRSEEGLDLFNDYQVSLNRLAQDLSQGECLLSHRISNLLQQLRKIESELQDNLKTKFKDSKFQHREVNELEKKRILEICKYGSRHWNFFRAI